MCCDSSQNRYTAIGATSSGSPISIPNGTTDYSGSIAQVPRKGVDGFMVATTTDVVLALGTLVINVTGSFVIGVVYETTSVGAVVALQGWKSRIPSFDVLTTIEALRAQGVQVVLNPAGKDGPASPKSQFKKADASGARFALIFGPDEVAQGQVAVKPLLERGEQILQSLSATGEWAQSLMLARQS